MRYSEDTRHAVRLSRAEVTRALKEFSAKTYGSEIPDTAELYLEQHKQGDAAASFIWSTKEAESYVS